MNDYNKTSINKYAWWAETEYVSVKIKEDKPRTKILKIEKCGPSCPHFNRAYSNHNRSSEMLGNPPYACHKSNYYIRNKGADGLFPYDCRLKVMD
jgi:hypothetical protein